jgi:small subunit ribosomal protein S7
VYGALEGVNTKSGQDPVVALKKALDNVRPTLEVRSRRVGGSTYQVPVEVKPHRANTLALRWLSSYAKDRREKTMTERLTNEILDASNGLGAAVKRREDTRWQKPTRLSLTTAGRPKHPLTPKLGGTLWHRTC